MSKPDTFCINEVCSAKTGDTFVFACNLIPCRNAWMGMRLTIVSSDQEQTTRTQDMKTVLMNY